MASWICWSFPQQEHPTGTGQLLLLRATLRCQSILLKARKINFLAKKFRSAFPMCSGLERCIPPCSKELCIKKIWDNSPDWSKATLLEQAATEYPFSEEYHFSEEPIRASLSKIIRWSLMGSKAALILWQRLLQGGAGKASWFLIPVGSCVLVRKTDVC